MYLPGDLVQVTPSCSIKHFRGMTAIVMQNMGQDATDHANGNYYRLQFSNGQHHIFYDKELTLLSKAGKS
jgi:hypothetical protein